MATRVRLLCLLLLVLAQARSSSQENQQQEQLQPEYQEEQQELQLQLAYELWQRQCQQLDKKQQEQQQQPEQASSGVHTRIAGGELAEPGMFPFVAALLLELRQPGALRQCGGSLITLQYVLTAAHCVTDATKANVFLGSTRYADAASSSEVFQVPRAEFHIYPGYLGFGGYNDLALLRLPRPATPSTVVQPIPLARPFMQQSQLEGKYVSTAGWGALGDGDASGRDMEANLLHFVQLQVLEQPRCICAYLPGLVSNRRHICSSGLGGRGACSGDSGGPLVYHWHNVSYLIGLTTFGSAMGCELGVPTVYTRITAYLEWITEEAGGAGGEGAGAGDASQWQSTVN